MALAKPVAGAGECLPITFDNRDQELLLMTNSTCSRSDETKHSPSGKITLSQKLQQDFCLQAVIGYPGIRTQLMIITQISKKLLAPPKHGRRWWLCLNNIFAQRSEEATTQGHSEVGMLPERPYALMPPDLSMGCQSIPHSRRRSGWSKRWRWGRVSPPNMLHFLALVERSKD